MVQKEPHPVINDEPGAPTLARERPRHLKGQMLERLFKDEPRISRDRFVKTLYEEFSHVEFHKINERLRNEVKGPGFVDRVVQGLLFCFYSNYKEQRVEYMEKNLKKFINYSILITPSNHKVTQVRKCFFKKEKDIYGIPVEEHIIDSAMKILKDPLTRASQTVSLINNFILWYNSYYIA